MAVGDCSVTERRRWRPPYQTGKTVHVLTKHFRHNEDRRTAPGVCGNSSVPLSHSENVVTRIGIHTRKTHSCSSPVWYINFKRKIIYVEKRVLLQGAVLLLGKPSTQRRDLWELQQFSECIFGTKSYSTDILTDTVM